jgi:AcrR family transcriptional regulator
MAPGGQATPRRLPRGGTALDPQTVERVHRERLHAAVVELISAKGYAATTVEDLTAAAGLSTTGFYALYRNKRACVVDAWDALLAELDGELAAAAERAQASSETTSAGLRAQLGEVIGALCDAAVRRPAAIRVLLQDAGSLGADGPARRHQIVDALQRRLGEATVVPFAAVAAATVAAGTVAVVEQRLRTGKQRSLRSAAKDLAAWGAGYDLAPAGPAIAPPTKASGTGDRPDLMTLPQGVNRLPRSFVDRHQRARILEAIRELTAEHGYEDLTLTQLSARARISNRTFYEHFTDLQGAFLITFQEAFTDLFARAYYSAAARESWSAAVAAGIAALTEAMRDSPATARFVLHDARSAGRTIGDAADEALGAFASLLTRGRSGARVPAVVPYAIVAGITSVAGDRVVGGHADQLPELTPQLCYLALAPFVGDRTAREAAGLRTPSTTDEASPPSTIEPSPLAASDQLKPLYTAFLELVEAQGFAHTRLEDVARRADVDPAVVMDAFLDETHLASAALDDASNGILAAMADAFIRGGEDLALATHMALGAMLGAMAAAPGVAQLAIVDLRGLDETTDARRERFFGMFGDVIGPRLPVLPPQPDVVLRIVADGLVELVGRYATDGRLDELTQSLPEISRRSLTPFFGPAEAERVATVPVPDAPAPRRS